MADSLVISPYAAAQPLTALTNALQSSNSGITILSSSFIGIDTQSGTYAGFSLPSSTAGLPTITAPNGVLLTTGSANLPLTNTSTAFSNETDTGSNAQLTALTGRPTFDQNVLTIQFTANASTANAIVASFVYSTDEYPEYAANFTDTFGYFVDGKNYAVFPDGSLVSITNATIGDFNDNNTRNGAGTTAYGLEYDGISNLLTVNGLLDPTVTTHTLTIAIADINDTSVDSGVFIGDLHSSAVSGGGGIVTAMPTINSTGGDIAPNIFSLGSSAAMAGTVTFDGGILQETGGSFANNIIVAPVTIMSTDGTVDTSTGSGGFAGVVSGAGSLTITGGNTFSLTSVNTYSGGTILSGSTLAVGNSAALGTGALTFGTGTNTPTLQATADALTIANAATLGANGAIDTQGFGLTYAGAIAGAGQLTKLGSGTLTLSGANTYAGGTVLSAGTVVVTNATSSGSTLVSSSIGTGTLVFDGGTLSNGSTVAGGLSFSNAIEVNAAGGTVDANSNNLAFTGSLSDGAGTGTLTFANTGGSSQGVVALGQSSTFSGGAVINSAAYVILNADNAIGTGRLDVEGGLELGTSNQAVTRLTGNGVIFSNTGFGPGASAVDVLTVQSGAFGGAIQENAPQRIALVKSSDGSSSGGTLVLSGSSLYSGTTTVQGGTLQAGSTTALSAASAYTVAGGATLDVGGFNSAVSSLAGAGRVTNGGVAAATLSAVGSDASSFGGTLADGAAPLTLERAGSGTLTLTGTNSYSGGTLLGGGVLGVGSNAALGAGGVAFRGGTLQAAADGLSIGNAAALGQNSTIDTQGFGFTYAGSIAGPAQLTKIGSGTLSLASANTFAGGTVVRSGTLAVADSAALGTGGLTLDDGTTLQFIASGLTLGNAIALPGTDPTIDTGGGFETISGAITGPGALTKIGAGTLALTGTSTYTGDTTVAAGTLQVDGSIASSSVIVDSGAVLGGGGTIGALTLQNGAALSPGGSKTLTVVGNATFASGSTYQVTINGDGTSNKLNVGGAAALGGSTLSVLAGSGTFGAATYTLLSAVDGVSGTFGTVNAASTLALLAPSIGYGANAVTLTLQPVAFASLAGTPNEAGSAAAIQALGPASPLYDAVLTQNVAGARQAFDSAAGASHADPVNIISNFSRLNTSLVLDRLWDVGGNGLSARDVLDQFAPDRLPALVRCYGPMPDPVPAAPQRAYTAWGEGFGSFGHNDATANAGALDRSLGGFVLGIDTPFQNVLGTSWRIGIAGGYTDTTYRSAIDGGAGTVQGAFGSLYGGARYGAVDVRVGATVGGTFTDARRTVAFPGFLEAERSSNQGITAQGFGEVGYRFTNASTVLEPIAGAAYLHVHQDGFSETGGAAALNVKALDTDLGTTSLGFRGEVAPFKDVPLTAHGLLAWQHTIGDITPATVLAFEANPSQTFSVTGAPIDRDALAAEAALDYRASAALDVGLSYTGLVGPTASDHSVKGRFEYRF